MDAPVQSRLFPCGHACLCKKYSNVKASGKCMTLSEGAGSKFSKHRKVVLSAGCIHLAGLVAPHACCDGSRSHVQGLLPIV
eukprot:768221-Hanusia_phi.AAC.15